MARILVEVFKKGRSLEVYLHTKDVVADKIPSKYQITLDENESETTLISKLFLFLIELQKMLWHPGVKDDHNWIRFYGVSEDDIWEYRE